jgi:hypothetical protein
MLEYPELCQRFTRDLALFEADMAAWKKKGRANGAPPPERPDEPQPKRYLVDDVTIEALADRLQHSPRGLLCATDELAGWLASFGQYKSGGRSGDVSRWLSIHNAKSLLIDRKTGPVKTIYIPRAAVSVCGGIQPGILGRTLGEEFMTNGLAARLLLAMPPRAPKRWTDATVDPDLQRQVDRVFGQLLALDFLVDDDGQNVPRGIHLDPDGKRAWIAFYDEHGLEQAALSGDLAAAWSKLEGYAPRLALIVHLVRYAAGDTTATLDAIDAQSIDAGVGLVRWFCNEVRRVYAALGETDGAREQRHLLEWIDGRGGRVTAREVQQGNRRFQTAPEAEAALDELVAAGYGTWEQSPTGQRGQPTRRFRSSTVSTSTEIP